MHIATIFSAGKNLTTDSKSQSNPDLCACAQACIDTCGSCNDCISTVASGFVTPIFNAWTNTSLAPLIPQARLSCTASCLTLTWHVYIWRLCRLKLDIIFLVESMQRQPVHAGTSHLREQCQNSTSLRGCARMRHACTLSWLRSLRQWLSHATKRGCGRGAQALFDFCMAQNNPSFSVCTRLQGYAETSPGFAGRPAAICNMARSFPLCSLSESDCTPFVAAQEAPKRQQTGLLTHRSSKEGSLRVTACHTRHVHD